MKTMKKVLFMLVGLFLLIGCENTEDVKNDLAKLKLEREKSKLELEQTKSKVRKGAIELSEMLKEFNEKQLEKGALESGVPLKYVLHLKLKQSHFTLDIAKHAKDAMNAAEFSLAVDKRLYDMVSKGDNIFKSDRLGSFITEGSMGNWSITVVGKEIQK